MCGVHQQCTLEDRGAALLGLGDLACTEAGRLYLQELGPTLHGLALNTAGGFLALPKASETLRRPEMKASSSQRSDKGKAAGTHFSSSLALLNSHH